MYFSGWLCLWFSCSLIKDVEETNHMTSRCGDAVNASSCAPFCSRLAWQTAMWFNGSLASRGLMCVYAWLFLPSEWLLCIQKSNMFLILSLLPTELVVNFFLLSKRFCGSQKKWRIFSWNHCHFPTMCAINYLSCLSSVWIIIIIIFLWWHALGILDGGDHYSFYSCVACPWEFHRLKLCLALLTPKWGKKFQKN